MCYDISWNDRILETQGIVMEPCFLDLDYNLNVCLILEGCDSRVSGFLLEPVNHRFNVASAAQQLWQIHVFAVVMPVSSIEIITLAGLTQHCAHWCFFVKCNGMV